jgi:hypothetical protein
LNRGKSFFKNRVISPISDTSLEYPISAEIQKFCEYNFKNLQRPFREIVWEMLDALIYGHKVAEITYKIDKYGDKNYLLLQSIKPKPFGSTSFIVDAYWNLLGITNTNIFASRETTNLFLNKNNFELADNQAFVKLNGKKFRFLNRNKFFALTVNSQNNDPRGRSILRPAFTPCNIKNKVHCEYLRYLNTSASPLLFGTTPEVDQQRANIVVDNLSVPVKDETGKIIRVNPLASLRDALMQAKNSGVLAAQGGSKLQSIGGDGAGIAFYKAIEVYDEQIEMCLLHQTLATSESRHQSRSASEVHFSTMEIMMNSYKLLVADAISQDILKPLIIFNFGEQYLKYMPKVSLGDTARRDFSLDAAAVSALYSANHLSEDQKRFTDMMLGLPVRDSEYDKIRTVTTEEQLQIRKNVLEQTKLKNESAKLKEEKNRLLTEQIAALGKTLELTTSPAIKTQLEGQLISLLNKLGADTEEDTLLEELQQSEESAKAVLRMAGDKFYDKPDELEQGLPVGGTEVGTNAATPLPISQTAARGGYIRTTKKLLS